MALLDADADRALVRIRDLAGRLRGTGFLADHLGTVVTSHEAVDGLARVVLQPMHGAGAGGVPADVAPQDDEPACLVDADAVTPLPEAALALVRTDGFGFPRLSPLPVAPDRPAPGTPVRLWAGGWRNGIVAGTDSGVTYTATDLFHLLGETLELALSAGGRDALRLGGPAAGGPVLDARTGAVLGVLGTALHSRRRVGGFAVPLRAVADATPRGALAGLLERNAATVPAYGSALNPAGALRLTAPSAARAGRPGHWREPVERPDVAREFSRFGAARERVPGWADGALVLGLVGDPGTGRSTELAGLAARRSQGEAAAPTLWLRGADLRDGDDGVRTAVERALHSAGRGLTAAGRTVGDPLDTTADELARRVAAAGRPLLLLLDGPEEMPTGLAHRLADWTDATAAWLHTAGVRLVIACRPEYWERAGALFPPGLLHRPEPASPPGAPPAWDLPACVRLGDLPQEQAARARGRYGLPEDWELPGSGAAGNPGRRAAPDACHPLALRLLAEVRAALPKGGPRPVGAPGRHEIFDAYLDLSCLRIAVRIAAGRRPPPRGTDVRRLAARVAGQVHEAARRCLGPGQGGLDGEAFEKVFPPEPGWGAAVLAEGLLVPAGTGYRFAHEEFAEWLQGGHLDLDGALRMLVHEGREGREGREGQGAPTEPGSGCVGRSGRLPSLGGQHLAGSGPSARAQPVPGHRIGPVVQALLLLARREGTVQLTRRLAELVPPATAAGPPPAHGEPRWWAAHLLGEALLRVPDATPYTGVLRLLADRITKRSVRAGGFAHTGLCAFGPGFWRRLRLADEDRMELLRVLLPADGPPAAAGGAEAATGRAAPRHGRHARPFAEPPRVRVHPADAGATPPPEGNASPHVPDSPQPQRFLDTTAELLRADPVRIQPLLCAWFDDTRRLHHAAPAGDAPPAPAHPVTVASAAQALLHTHRRRALDDLAEALVAAAHPKADELLDALAEDEPSAVCRAVDRWAHDARPERRQAAASYGLRVAPYAATDADRALLRYGALTLLSRSADGAQHGPALALLVGDRTTRSQVLERALARFVAGDPRLPPVTFADALASHPDQVLDAFRTRLLGGAGSSAATAVLRVLVELDGSAPVPPTLAYRAADLVREYAEKYPDHAARHIADSVDRRLEHGPGARAAVRPLVVELLMTRSAPIRCALAPVLAAAGSGDSAPLRRVLLDILLAGETCHAKGRTRVLEAVLRAAAEDAEQRPEDRTRELVHRTGLLLARTPEGAACFDRRLGELGRRVPGFARRVREWVATEPGEWAAIVGPGARATLAGCPG
ncbi:serine protease [Streptomyces piniterrae]|uniref:serine protease n=1 Tax=Streptomyces piniterrae TaxID=2571125 RepID=UPI001FE41F5B|nr:serine protease [Streptomyces piniterrae]